MTSNDLIAAVALDFIKSLINQESKGSLRYCILGFKAHLVCSIADAVLSDTEARDKVAVRISPIFAPDADLPKELISEESITRWRHCQIPEGKRAILFAASQEELQRNDKSVEKVTKIETDTLRTRYAAWIDNSGLTRMYLDEVKRNHLLAALESANTTHIARTIETFADFVLAISNGIILEGLPLQRAIDNALPNLKLPRNAGDFNRIPEMKRNTLLEWNKIFRRLHSRIRPLLVRETDRREPISPMLLKSNFEELKNHLNDTECSVINNFINADLQIDNWSDCQRDLVELDWRKICDLFKDVKKKTNQSLGKKTIEFFDDEFDSHLDENTRELLAGNLPKDPTDDLQDFFESHREHLVRDKKLSTSWERYLYRNPKFYNDFFIGLLATFYQLRRFTSDDEITENNILIQIPNAREKSFWRSKNPRVMRYFAFRYRGLKSLFGENIDLDFGRLEEFYFPQIDADLAKITSRSKDARSIKFEVIFDPNGARSKMIFHWEMPINAIAMFLPEDLLAIANDSGKHALLPTADIIRQPVSSKGSIQRVALDDVNTILDVDNTNSGKIVDPNKEDGDISDTFLIALKELSGIINYDHSVKIRKKFDDFLNAFTKAIRKWISMDYDGITSNSFIMQANAYGDLLRCLMEYANNDRSREILWKEILRIGIANVSGGAPATIITPWHPLRLAEINIKAQHAAQLIQSLIHAKEDDISGADSLFDQFQREIISNFYPEICIGFYGIKPVLLAASETSYDYTLAESPLRPIMIDGDKNQDIDSSAVARAFGTVGDQYLKLLPHERNNFSIILYNAESKSLPSALASEISEKVQQDSELQCDLFLTHSDPASIRRIYEQQNASVSNESESILASDGSRNFLSRMRVGLIDMTDISKDESGRSVDLVALQDVIARNAKLIWKKAPNDRQPILTEHIPTRWSRRRPIGAADTATTVYLASPSQPQVGQSYLNAIQFFLNGDNSLSEDVIPAREVNFRDETVSNVFLQTHQIGEWVVNFDELVDRRLLKNNNIQVIRHIHDHSINRNIVVSTTSNSRLLSALLIERLNRLDPAIILRNKSVVDCLIDRANTLSGQVVMRAARYGHYVNELLGIVLSMEKIDSILGGINLPLGWYFLDDFYSWFGQHEEQIADIMAIAPRMENGNPVLKVAISEAKFISSVGHRAQAKKSAKQLHETVARIGRALGENYRRIDRSIWLHRLGNFMIDGIEPFDSDQLNGWDIYRWSDEVRQDRIAIQITGFSHVFVHDDDEYVDTGDIISLKGMPNCWQEVFDKSRVANALRSFALIHKKSEVKSTFDNCDDTGIQNSSRTNQQYAFTEDQESQGSEEEEILVDILPREILQSNSISREDDIGENRNPSEIKTSLSNVESDNTQKEERYLVAKECRNRWPSLELDAWVNAGRTSDDVNGEASNWLNMTVISLQRALRGYNMTAELVDVRLTPNAALVRFRGSNDLTVPKVEKRRQELLTSHAIDVINILAAPMEVIVMVARPNRRVLLLRDIWRQRETPSSMPLSNTSLLLGACEADGEMLYLNVEDEFGRQKPHGPHTLIAGETGSGKGVLVQCLLLDICATNSPLHARIKMIDPKAGIDFPWLRQMPHLDGDLITDRETSVQALESLVDEMERRNHLLAAAGVTKLSRYNQKVEPGECLPRIWLFHDELADWMMIKEYRDAVELSTSRLGVKARAAGINLVLVTQRPDKDALPMQLRANLSNRLVLKVADKRNSELVLDAAGAERLLGRGHLAAKLSGEGKIIFAQVPFIGENEIFEVAEIIARAW